MIRDPVTEQCYGSTAVYIELVPGTNTKYAFEYIRIATELSSSAVLQKPLCCSKSEQKATRSHLWQETLGSLLGMLGNIAQRWALHYVLQLVPEGINLHYRSGILQPLWSRLAPHDKRFRPWSQSSLDSSCLAGRPLTVVSVVNNLRYEMLQAWSATLCRAHTSTSGLSVSFPTHAQMLFVLPKPKHNKKFKPKHKFKYFGM